jgi:predicted nucleic acid-binding Zn ribbon protein
MKSRTPKNFDGTFSPGVKIGELLPELLREIGKNREIPREALFQEWQNLIGEKMAPMTRPISFEDGVLTVIVKSSTLYSLLRVHERPRLLRKLQEKFQVRDLVFKIG